MKIKALVAGLAFLSASCVVEPAIKDGQGNGISIKDSQIQLSENVPNVPCGDDQILIWTNGRWECGQTPVPSCTDDQELSWNDNQWVCSDGKLPNCNDGDTLYRNNGQWECTTNSLNSLNCSDASFPTWDPNSQSWNCSIDSSASLIRINTALDVNGNLAVSGDITTNSLTETSSRRYKTNIQAIQKPLNKLQKLQGVTYVKTATGKQDIGLIAEDVAEIFPELVSTNAQGQIEAMNYGRLTSVLIEAVKSQQKQIDHLTEQHAKQAKHIKQLLKAQ